jgi:hypothetical protein
MMRVEVGGIALIAGIATAACGGGNTPTQGAETAAGADRDKRMDFNTADERGDRADLISLARPQGGVDAMARAFPNAKPVPGVNDNGDTFTRSVPRFEMVAGNAAKR